MARVEALAWSAMERLRFASTFGSLALAACAPDEVTPAELDEVCGQPSPFRLLELDAGETVSHVGQVAFVDGRRVLQIGYLDEENAEASPATTKNEIWSVGECGENPIRLTADAEITGGYAVWPDVVLGCRADTGEIVTIDPHGERPPNVVFQLPDCRGEPTPWGVIGIQPHDEDTGALVLLPYPEDPWTQTASPRVLLDPIRIRATPEPHMWPAYHEVLRVFDDELFAIDAELDLVRLSLLDGSVTTEATNVREFEVSRDLHWIVWQDATETETDNPEWPEGAIFSRDRTVGTTTHLADTALAYTGFSPFDFIDEGFIRLYLGGFGTQPQRFFSTTSAATFEVPPGHRLRTTEVEGRWLDSGLWGYGPFRLFDRESAAFVPLFDHEGEIDFGEQRSLILQASARALLHDVWRLSGRLWSVTADGERELLANRVGRNYRMLADDRVVSVLDPDTKWRGDLVAVDRDSLEEQLVDTNVAGGAWVLDDGETTLYGVSDRERTGVWLARLAPLD